MADSIQDTRTNLQRRYGALVTERESWMTHWRELSAFIMPRSGRFFIDDVNKGNKRQNNIYDSTATRAIRVLGAGLMGGATSPARPWFRLGLEDEDLMQYGPVKEWLSQSTQSVLNVFAKSNHYRTLHSMYEELGLFGTASSLLMDDFKSTSMLYQMTAGEYVLMQDYKGTVVGLMRRFKAQVGAIVREFGYKNCSTAIQNMWDRGTLDAWVTIIHCVEPRYDRDPTMRDSLNMAWKSIYFEDGSNEDKFLREGGFKEFRGLCPRWAVTGLDIYGNSPAMEALGDIKQLQHQQIRKAEGIDYMTKPPLQIPSSLKNKDINRMPGGHEFVDPANPNGGIKPMFEVNLNLQHLLADIQDVRGRINQTCYTDLFLMLSQSTDTIKTATEVAELHEEKMLMLGPVLERLHNELLDPLVSMSFTRALEAGMLPPPPQELQGQQLNVQFISVLAQAQRAVSTSSIDRFVGNIGQMAAFKPDVLDKFNSDKWADIYSDILGVDPELVVGDDKVAIIRQQRAQAQQAAQKTAMAEQAASAANKLGNTPTGTQNALTDVMKNFQGYT